MGRKLIRTMRGEEFEGLIRPVLGENISRILGVRHRIESVDPGGDHFDIVTNDQGIIKNIRQGLSVAPPPKENMPPHLLRLKRGEAYFCIDEFLFEKHSDLEYIEDDVELGKIPKHGIIAPRYEMHIEYYISCLSATRRFWEVLYDEIDAENDNTSALTRQLNAESKNAHFRTNK